MSGYVGATGNTIYSERFQEIEDRIDIDEINISNIQKELYFGSYSITSNLNRVIDVSSNIFLNLYVGPNSITCNLLNINSNLYIGDFSVSSNIKYLKNEIQNETQSNPKTAIYRVKQLELVVGDFSSGYGSKNIIDPQTLAIIGNTIYDAFVSIGSTIANLGAIVTIWPAIGVVATASQIAQANAQTANNKADRLLLMWDDSGNNVYFMKSGNLAIGILPKGSVLNNKLEVSGNINITNGSTYKVNNVNFGYSNLDHKLTAGTNISIGADYKINNTLTSGTNISIVSGVINNTYTYTLPIAQGSTGNLGGVKVDGNTITIDNTGVISAVVAGSGGDIFLDGGVNNRAYGWVNSTSSLGRVGVAGNYSTGSAVEDIVLRSQGKLIFQSGITTPCMVIDTTNNAFFRNNVGIGTSILTINNVLDVGTKLKVSSTAPSDSLTIAGTSGNVGLGITTATNLLHLHKTAVNSDLRFQITDGGTGSLAANGLVLGKGTNNRYFLYNYANTDLYFGTNANERLTITAGGNIGIGVTNPPNALLHLHKTSLVSEVKLQLTDGTTTSATNTGLAIYKGTDQNGYFWNYQNNDLIFGTNNTEKMRITGTALGSVGIGTNSPNSVFHIHREFVDFGMSILITDATTTSALGRGFRIQKQSTEECSITNCENKALIFGTNNTERMRISADGNVGIGTNNPTSKLHITTPDVATAFSLLDFRNTANYGIYATSISVASRGNTLDFLARDYNFGTIQTRNVLTLRPDGNVGIGITNPAYRLHFKTTYDNIPTGFHLDADDGDNNPNKYALTIYPYVVAGGSVGWRFRTQSLIGGSQIPLQFDNSGGLTMFYMSATGYILSNSRIYSRNGGYDTWLYSDSGGMTLNMGNQSTEGAPTYFKMGAYNSQTYLESNQSRSFVFRIWVGTFSGTAPTWRFDPSFNCFNANNSTSWNQASDQRIKENIVKADLKTCYDNIKNINLYRYKFIDAFDNGFKDKNKLGYIAQEVKKHFPKATYRDKKRLNDNREIPDLLSIDVEQINASLYGAVKQLIKVVEKQSKRIKALEILLNIEDNDDVEDDSGQPFERIYDEEVDIDTIEPTEPPTGV